MSVVCNQQGMIVMKKLFKKCCTVLFILLLICSISCINGQTKKSVTKDNRVPNEEAAIKIAEANWLPIYGEEVLKEKPYRVELIKDSIWIVSGTTPKLKANEDFVGGTAYIEIRKADGKVLKVTHGK